MRWILLLLTLGALQTTGCPSEECTTDADCGGSQVCSPSHQCVAGFVPQASDAGRIDRYWEDRAAEDAPAEDAILDGGIGDRPVPEAGAYDGGGTSQVPIISTCAKPQAVAVSGGGEIFVACYNSTSPTGDGDTIKVYNSVTGQLRRDLGSLPSPCGPSSLLLRDDIAGGGQLWVGCAAGEGQGIYNVDPASGSPLEAKIELQGASTDVRFASGGSYVGWVFYDTVSYSLRRINSRTSTSDVLQGADWPRGSDMALRSNGSELFLSRLGDRSVRRYDVSRSVQSEIFLEQSGNELIAVTPEQSTATQAPSPPVLLILSTDDQSVTRGQLSTGESLSSETSVTVTVSGRAALTVHPDGRTAYLGSATGRVLYKLNTAPSATLIAGSRNMSQCAMHDVAVAYDGRVFVACNNNANVEVLRPGEL